MRTFLTAFYLFILSCVLSATSNRTETAPSTSANIILIPLVSLGFLNIFVERYLWSCQDTSSKYHTYKKTQYFMNYSLCGQNQNPIKWDFNSAQQSTKSYRIRRWQKVRIVDLYWNNTHLPSNPSIQYNYRVPIKLYRVPITYKKMLIPVFK